MSGRREKICRVAVSSLVFGIDRPFDYIVPPELEEKLAPGCRVIVPFGRGNRKREGVVLAFRENNEDIELKTVISMLDEGPILTDEQMKLVMWMRERFFCTVYDAVHAMLPPGIWYKDDRQRIGDKTSKWAVLSVPGKKAAEEAEKRQKKAPRQAKVLEFLASAGRAPMSEITYYTGADISVVKRLARQGFAEIEEVDNFRRPKYEKQQPAGEIHLNGQQQSALNVLEKMAHSGQAGVSLLYGVTGSGKTLVYISLIKSLLREGKKAIVLVPEIALTPQLVHIFSSHFGDKVAVMHSSLTTGERYDEWKRVKSGSVDVVVGTRTAVFAPVSNLGVIIMDEEQEHTYKSGSSPRYHTRDVAKFRCAYNGALLVLGSATPSIETMKNAKDGVYKLVELTERFNEKPLPPVIIADMRREIKSGNGTSISAPLAEELEKNLEKGEQSILFINRRGAAGLVVCGECGYTFTCPNCSVSMTYHSANGKMMCHYCGHAENVADVCPECGGKLKFSGTGTQKVEQEIKERFPGIEVVRMDLDTVSRARSHEKLLAEFRDKKIPILLGTQMVTKGLDFENVTLVGVVSADQSLYSGDYKAHERTFSLITQVVGRSGRGEKDGRAVIQTFTPSNEVITLASKQDYMSFFERELDVRNILGCPPAKDIIMLTVSGASEEKAVRGAGKLQESFSFYFRGNDDIKVLGPAPAQITKMSNKYRYRVLVSCASTKKIRETIAFVMREFSQDKENSDLSVTADVNPEE